MIELTQEQSQRISHEPTLSRRAKAGPTKRGKRRNGQALGFHMSSFWQLPAADKVIIHELSKRGAKR